MERDTKDSHIVSIQDDAVSSHDVDKLEELPA